MRDRLCRRESGIVFLATLMVAMVLFATTAAILSFSASESSVLEDRVDMLEALYLAEAGLEAAKREIGSGDDEAGDGLGNVTGSTTTGDFSVTAVDLGGTYELTATGTSSSGSIVVVESTIELEYATVFPGGAISLIGDFADTDITWHLHENLTLGANNVLILDGGTGPALSFSSESTYNEQGAYLAQQIYDATLPAGNLTGGATNTFTYSGTDYELPLAHEPDYDSRLDDLSALFSELHTKADELLSVATSVSSLSGTYGDADNPVTIYFDSATGSVTDSVTGYGTLILDDLNVASGGNLNWTGDVFVISSVEEATPGVSGGVLNVTGNMILLAGGGEIKYEVDSGQATINGNLFAASDWNAFGEGEAAVKVKDSGSMVVNGVVTAIGKEPKLKVEGSGASLVVNGMVQLAVPASGHKLSLDLDGDGRLEVYVDAAQIAAAANSLYELGVEHDMVEEVELIVTAGEIKTKSWTKK